MQSEKCPEYVRLQAEVEAVLEKLTQLTSFQLNAFRASDQAEFMRADKELELTVGIKERTIGALRQHSRATGNRIILLWILARNYRTENTKAH